MHYELDGLQSFPICAMAQQKKKHARKYATVGRSSYTQTY